LPLLPNYCQLFSLLGKEVFIPVKAIHTVRNIGNRNNAWYYGYKEISVVSL